jgi:hypothetical protein
MAKELTTAEKIAEANRIAATLKPLNLSESDRALVHLAEAVKELSEKTAPTKK